MNEVSEEPTPITRALVPEDQRLDVTAELFGAHFPLCMEPTIYRIADQIAHDYNGGYWQFWRLSNGGFLMTLEDDREFAVRCMNYWQGTMSADALGIVACLTAYSLLSFTKGESFARLCAQHYHLLRPYLYDHKEVQAILAAID